MILAHRPGAFPTLTMRALATLHVGMYDAVVAAWDSKDAFSRTQPAALDSSLRPSVNVSGPSYPDLNSVIAGAAENILQYLFPQENPKTFTDLADQAGVASMDAGVAYRTDVVRGRKLGHDVAAAVVAYAGADGSQTPWDGKGRVCSTADCGATGTFSNGTAGGDGCDNYPTEEEQNWVPTLPFCQWPPTSPGTAKWKTWYMTSPGQLRPGPPPAYGSQEFFTQLCAARDAVKNATPADEALAFSWDDGPGTYSPAGHWNSIAIDLVRNRKLGTERTARLFMLMNTAIFDAFVAVWDTKYTYWSIRPETVIHRQTVLGQPNPCYEKDWRPLLITPPFPSYISGHAGESAAGSRVLQYLLPDQGQNPDGIIDDMGPTGSIDSIAEQVARSRLVGGIHFPIDNSTSLVVGREVARLVIHWAQQDGSGINT
jgi:hypothetical protein